MAPVLVQGESGTGKELVARAIHEVSARGAQPFIAVNCGAIPEHLLEAEFFGYRKGAFTGANEDRDGFFQAAQGGTLFLDEIGDLPLAMQSKLLRVIQERSVRPVGAVSETPVNVRIVSATHKDLGAEVQAGRFRQDLYYRLNVIQIRVPPLRERMRGPGGRSARRCSSASRATPASWPPPSLTREALRASGALCLPGQRARTREPAAPRGGAVAAARRSTRDDLGLPDDVFTDSASRADRVADRRAACEQLRAAPADAAVDGAAAGRPGGLSRRGRARHPRARARAPPLQPHRRRRQPGLVAAPDALPHGAAGRQCRGKHE